jgi:hypothetical protein
MKSILIILLLTSAPLLAQEWTDADLWVYNDFIFSVTSELDDGIENEGWNTKYGGVNLYDGNFSTAWVEGIKGDGIGQAIWVSIPDNCKTISILNGYGKSPALFSNNNRVKRLKLTCYAGINPSGYVTENDLWGYKMQLFPKEAYLDLKDLQTLQTFIMPFSDNELSDFKLKVLARFPKDFKEEINKVHLFLRLEIESVFKGLKWSDTCISELFFSNSFVSDNRKIKYPVVKNIYVDEGNNSRIMIDTPDKKRIILVNDPSWIFQIAETTSNNFWATVIRMPAKAVDGRTETEYIIIDTRLGTVLNSEISKTLGKPLYGPLLLQEEEGVVFLEHSDGKIRIR